MKATRFVSYWDATPDLDYRTWTAMYRDENGSHVSGEELHRRGKPIPFTPDYPTWCHMVATKKRCGLCWASLKGAADFVHHIENNHTIKKVVAAA
jgi:hypothetical protein